MSDLDPVLRGLQYCREKTAQLHQEATAFALSRVKVEILGRELPPMPDGRLVQGRSGFMKATLTEDLPDRFGRECGTVMNELRAQLDHLANILGRRNFSNDDESSYPILNNANEINAQAKRKIRRLSESDQQKIWDLQPFNAEENAPILALHNTDNFRKHRRPLGFWVDAGVGIGGSGRIGIMTPANDRFPLRQAGDQTGVVYFQNVTVKLVPNFQLTFIEPPEMSGWFAVPFLWSSADAVERIVRAFE